MSIDILPWHQAALAELLSRRASLPHALLVYGRPGVGKLEFASAIAQSLLCESPDNGIACGKCLACGWYREGNHPDFRELFPEALGEDEADGEGESHTDTPAGPEAKVKTKSKEI